MTNTVSGIKSWLLAPVDNSKDAGFLSRRNVGEYIGAAAAALGIVTTLLGIAKDNGKAKTTGGVVALLGLAGWTLSALTKINSQIEEKVNKDSGSEVNKDVEKPKNAAEKDEAKDTKGSRNKANKGEVKDKDSDVKTENNESSAFYEKLLKFKNEDEVKSFFDAYESSKKPVYKLIEWTNKYLKAEKENLKKDFTDKNDVTLRGLENSILLLKVANSRNELAKLASDQENNSYLRILALKALAGTYSSTEDYRRNEVVTPICELLEKTSFDETPKKWALTGDVDSTVAVKLSCLEIVDNWFKNSKVDILSQGKITKAIAKCLYNSDPLVITKAAQILTRECLNTKGITTTDKDLALKEIKFVLGLHSTPKEAKGAILNMLVENTQAIKDDWLYINDVSNLSYALKELQKQKHINIDEELLASTIAHLDKVHNKSYGKVELEKYKEQITCLNDFSKSEKHIDAIKSLCDSIQYSFHGAAEITSVVINCFTNRKYSDQVRAEAGNLLLKTLIERQRFKSGEDNLLKEIGIENLISCSLDNTDNCTEARKNCIELLKMVFKETRNLQILNVILSCARDDKNPAKLRVDASGKLDACSWFLKSYRKVTPGEYDETTKAMFDFLDEKIQSKDKTDIEIMNNVLYTLGGVYRSTENKGIINKLISLLHGENIDYEVRAKIAYELGMTGTEEAMETLVKSLKQKDNPELQCACANGLSGAAELYGGGGIAAQLAWLVGGNTYVHDYENKKNNTLKGVEALLDCILEKGNSSNLRTEAITSLYDFVQHIGSHQLKESDLPSCKAIRDSHEKLKSILENPVLQAKAEEKEFLKYLYYTVREIEDSLFGRTYEWDNYSNYSYGSGVHLSEADVKTYLKHLEFEETDNPSAEEIKRRYRKLALRYHPDKNPGDKDAKVMFKLIQTAYENLYDWKSSQEKGSNSESADLKDNEEKVNENDQQERPALN